MTIHENETTLTELEETLARAAAAAPTWASATGADRALALDAVAEEVEVAADDLVELAQQETHLPQARLRGELKRTTFQLRLFADVVREGAFLDARVDRPDPQWPMGAPRPDLRRVLLPLGPVVVFAAGNFPFAFSVAGGDTASALAAGCPVVLKVHPGHPRLSIETARAVEAGLRRAGAPDGVFSLVQGLEAGREALVDARVRAGAFTGSIAGGRALFDLATSREVPIPFFAEMGSVNPVFVTRAAAADRPESIAEGFLASVMGSAGQLCTKPGLLFVPADSGVAERLGALDVPPAGPLLDDRIRHGFEVAVDRLGSRPGVDLLAQAAATQTAPAATLLRTTVRSLLEDYEVMTAECFGPAALVVAYTDEAELEEVAARLDGQLTASVHAEPTDDVRELVRLLADRAGRLLWNEWPTGVSVTYAQQHGGPYPATTAASSTSVGTAAIERFLRPVAYQGFPQSLLPAALRDDNPWGVPQRVDEGH